eukprot:3132436-Rhodomonas_salina.1
MLPYLAPRVFVTATERVVNKTGLPYLAAWIFVTVIPRGPTDPDSINGIVIPALARAERGASTVPVALPATATGTGTEAARSHTRSRRPSHTWSHACSTSQSRYVARKLSTSDKLRLERLPVTF